MYQILSKKYFIAISNNHKCNKDKYNLNKSLVIIIAIIIMLTLTIAIPMMMISIGAKDAACTRSLCSIRPGSTNGKNSPCPLESGPSSRFLGQPATGTRRVAGTTHTESGRR